MTAPSQVLLRSEQGYYIKAASRCKRVSEIIEPTGASPEGEIRKSVVAVSVTAARGAKTLVLVHLRQLVEQSIVRLETFLDLPASVIGRPGGDRHKPGGIIDVCVTERLVRKGEVDDVVAGYGHFVVDECHHISAVSFEHRWQEVRSEASWPLCSLMRFSAWPRAQ